MSWYGGYSLHLYCDNKKEAWPNGEHAFEEFPHQYTAETGGECRSRARKAGWLIGKHGHALCPKCSGKEKGPNVTNVTYPKSS